MLPQLNVVGDSCNNTSW